MVLVINIVIILKGYVVKRNSTFKMALNRVSDVIFVEKFMIQLINSVAVTFSFYSSFVICNLQFIFKCFHRSTW